MSVKQNNGIVAVVEAIKAGFSAEASALKSLALSFFSLPLMDKEGIAAMWTGFTPELIAWAKRSADVPPDAATDVAEVIRDTAGKAMSDYAGQVRSYVVKVTLSQIPAVVTVRDAYGRGEYPINLRAAYNLALGKKAHGGGRGQKDDASEAVAATEKLSKAEGPVKVEAITAIFKSMNKAEQAATLAVLNKIHSDTK